MRVNVFKILTRLLILNALAFGFTACGGEGDTATGVTEDPVTEAPESKSICDDDCFPNGVAAGDVDPSSVVLWARASFTGKGTVRFEYGRDPDFVQAPDGVEDVVVENSNIPAKVYPTGLLAGTQYYYRACRDSCSSAVAPESEARGKFFTPYENGNHGLKFGVSSCWRGDMKPFVSIKNVPDRDLDFFVALGDTVYADSRLSDGSSPRATDLTQFRNKHKLAYSQLDIPKDNMFALARASTAFYVDIDDHEVVDNFAGGALPTTHSESLSCIVKPDARCLSFCDLANDVNPYPVDDPNYDPNWIPNCARDFINETDFYKYALQAWHEYNPIREERYGDTRDARTAFKNKLYRNRTFGKDAALFMLDTRSFRDANKVSGYDEGLTMLGTTQLEDLKRDLQDAENNGITWKFVLVPEPIQNLGLPFTGEDRFEGYDYERGIILNFIETNCIANVVFISGDIHASIVNNLSYKNSALGLQRFSTSWDISTGPVAYSGNGIVEFGKTIIVPGPTGTIFTRGGEGEPREPLDLLFRVEMDVLLTAKNRPRTGLEPDNLSDLLFQQQQNRFVPATLLQGSYVAGHSYGWTEFEINAATQKLTVTTWGIDWYEPPSRELNPGEPYILHRFEVLPRNGCPRCGDGICDANFPLLEKCGGNDTTLLQCRSDCGKCGNGELCGDDNMCASGLCNVGICTFPQENGQPCARDEGCESGICNFAICVSPQPNGNICDSAAACISGICKLGRCAACEAGGKICISGSSCCSGSCDSGFCKAQPCKNSGASCGSDWECCSTAFNACSGFIGKKTCK